MVPLARPPAAGAGMKPEGVWWKRLALVLALFAVTDHIGLWEGLGLDPADYTAAARAGGRLLGGSSPPADDAHSDDAHSGNSTGAHEDGEHHAHPHEAMFFLVIAILIGNFMLHLTSIPMFKSLQQTVMLFVLGIFTSLFMWGLRFTESLGPVGRSYEMWMAIDPHLLLFTLLPPLLAGDAMTIDTHVAKKVAKQCLFLAGPGVLINAFITALFLLVYLPYDWPFLLCLTTGSILCATDPVAVVALLKELGASPTLTVQIQGESLLNDGTAIVLYFVSYELLKGAHYDTGDIVVLLVKMALYAVLLGMIIGGLFFLWMRMVSNKYNHNSSMIQVSLTIACAYLSFTLSEGLFHISGVLATVASSLLLADKMWPEVVSHETMHTIWHIFEYLGNTIIFFLAGALTGRKMVDISFVDYLHLIVIYVALLVIRCSMILLSRPILRMLRSDRKPVPVADALVMGWGGLRGAVGLALAIQVSIDNAGGKIDQKDGDRVLFYVGGVALLTLVVNATTCPHLVRYLGITQTPAVKKQLMKIIHAQLGEFVQAQDVGVKSRVSLNYVLEDMADHIDPTHGEAHQADAPEDEEFNSMGDSENPELGHEHLLHGGGEKRQSLVADLETKVRKSIVKLPGCMEKTNHIIEELREVKKQYDDLPTSLKDRTNRVLPQGALFDQIPDMEEILTHAHMDRKLVRAINEAFLAILESQYWKLINSNLASTSEATVLLSSVKGALSDPSYDLQDFEEVRRKIPWPVPKASRLMTSNYQDTDADVSARDLKKSALRRLLDSTAFDLVIMFSIITNAVFILIEDYSSDANLSNNTGWIVIEIMFTTVFTLEFLLRFADARLQYFLDAWNVFDFALVVLGLMDIVVTLAVMGTDTSIGAKESQMARAAKVTKVLRAVRIIRFLRMCQQLHARLAGKRMSQEIADHMENFDILMSFVTGHLNAQKELVQYFGTRNKVSSPEVARCVLQSFVSVYKGMIMCAYEETFLDENTLEETRTCRETIGLTEELETFVLGARNGGVLTSAQAELLIHIMHDHVNMFSERIDDVRLGRERASSRGASGELDGGDKPGFQRANTAARITLNSQAVVDRE